MSIYKQQWRGVFALCAGLALLVLSFGHSGAFSIRISLGELSDMSHAIVQGRVERIESYWAADGAIESAVRVRLTDAPRGAFALGAVLPVRISGGTIDGLSMASSEEATFAVGEEVYLFLARADDGYRVAAGKQGKFELAGERAVNRAWGRAYRLEELNAGARGGTWPVEGASVEVSESSAEAGLAPDDYQYTGARWLGPNPMQENYEINLNTADAGGANGSADAFRNAITAAANAWSNAGAAFRFGAAGSSGVAAQANDNHNVIYWQDLGNVPTLAEAKWWYTSAGNILDADIRINDYYAWDATGRPASNEPDLQSVILHELGHWLSLGHDTASPCSSASGPIMCATYQFGSVKRTLNANDVAGIRAIYGTGAVTPSTPTRTPTPTVTRTPSPTWTPSRTPTPTRTPTPLPTLDPRKVKSRQYLPMIYRQR